MLAELLAQPQDALGIAPPVGEAATTSADRLRAGLAEAAAAEGSGVDRWREQLARSRASTTSSVRRPRRTSPACWSSVWQRLLRHTVEERKRSAFAEILSDASALAGVHALDRGAPDMAWRHYERARTTAALAQSPRALAAATCGLVEVLVEVGEPEVALTLLADTDRDITSAHPAPVRLAAARAIAAAAACRPSVALAALAEIAASGPQQASADAPSTRAIDRVYPTDSSTELADVHRWRGRALALLGEQATDDLRVALGAEPGPVRHRAEVLADLAAALAADAPEEADAYAREARDLAVRIGAPRLAARLTTRGQAS